MKALEKNADIVILPKKVAILDNIMYIDITFFYVVKEAKFFIKIYDFKVLL